MSIKYTKMEALDNFLKSVSDQSLCNWFFSMYILMVVFVVFQVINIIYTVSGLFYLKSPQAKVFALVAILSSLVAGGIGVFNSLFLYSLCDRSLVRDKA